MRVYFHAREMQRTKEMQREILENWCGANISTFTVYQWIKTKQMKIQNK